MQKFVIAGILGAITFAAGLFAFTPVMKVQAIHDIILDAIDNLNTDVSNLQSDVDDISNNLIDFKNEFCDFANDNNVNDGDGFFNEETGQCDVVVLL